MRKIVVKICSLVIAALVLGGTQCHVAYASELPEADEIFADSNPDTFAEKSDSTRAIFVPIAKYYWLYSTSSAGTEMSGNWYLFYNGYPAAETGEIDTVTVETSYSHTFSGSFAVDVKENVEFELGYSFGKTESFSVSKASRPLQKGEYIKAYYIKSYELTNVFQRELKCVEGWEQQADGTYKYVDYSLYTGNTKEAVAKRAISPSLKLEYYKVNITRNAEGADVNQSSPIPTAVEYYEYIDGQYVLVGTEEIFE